MSNINVYSFNVLSTHLADPSFFIYCNPENLNPANRTQKLVARLCIQMQKYAVICLQEVSYDLASRLFPLFQSCNYYCVTSHYGKKMNGYMGILIAFPSKKYNLMSVKMERIGDLCPAPVETPPTIYTRLYNFFFPPKNVVENPMLGASKRNNVAICCVLQAIGTTDKFAVANYHMPCEYRNAELMKIHAIAVTKWVQSCAEGKPFIFAGDFNITPNSACYNAIVDGTAETFLMRSAYKTFIGREPLCTNYSRVGNRPEFIDCIDYIFFSELRVLNVTELPNPNVINGPLPNDTEPSDHLALEMAFSFR